MCVQSHPQGQSSAISPTSSWARRSVKLLAGPGCCSAARCASSLPSTLTQRMALRHMVPLRVLLLLM
jgi:hypothetical protein